ncbi:MAG: UDP-glucose 4-epimerase GalE [Candidatus Pelethousia sp.]|nr:UDP-glucose 4-epimerase GalE [Candidatus Pelethousia sp.]
MRILLTGGAGFIGSHTAVALMSRDKAHDIVIADNFSNSSPRIIERLEKLCGRKPQIYTVDVAQESQLERVFAENQIDAVLHFAGLKSVGESVCRPLLYYKNNFNSTLSLLQVMEKYHVHNLVFSSSATVYGAPEKLPVSEDMAVGPCSNPYGWTKLMIEQIIQDYALAHPSFSAVLLRYFNPVGAHESGLIGESPKEIPNNLMPYISRAAVGRCEYLCIFGNDYPTKDGTGVRDYIHVVDLAKGHVAALDFCLRNRGVEIFNLGTGKGYSVLEMVQAFESVNHVSVPCRIEARRPGDIAACYADTAKAKRVLGWQAELDLADMCRDTWNWQRNNPNGFED